MRRAIVILVACSVLMTAALGMARAQIGGGYELTWHTVDGGGTTSASGGAYRLAGTVGQPDVGSQTGGAYTLQGGFWGGSAYLRQVYLPLVKRNM